MSIVVEWLDANGRVRRGMPDPAGGTFDAAGVVEVAMEQVPALAVLDPFGTVLLGPDEAARLADGLVGRDGDGSSEASRGLGRLSVLAQACARHGGLLRCEGD